MCISIIGYGSGLWVTTSEDGSEEQAPVDAKTRAIDMAKANLKIPRVRNALGVDMVFVFIFFLLFILMR
jgi:hypothetical protein